MEGYLKGLVRPMTLLCSKKGNGKTNKFIACSNLTISTRGILTAYAGRWRVEVYHRSSKSYLGMTQVAAMGFDSVNSHVHWVYCAYLLLQDMKTPEPMGLTDRQKILAQKMEAEHLKKIIHLSTRFEGGRQVKTHCQEVLSGMFTAKPTARASLRCCER